SAVLLQKIYGGKANSLLPLALFTAFCYPVWETVLLGQLSIALLFCLCLFLLALQRDRPFLAGLALAPLSIKPHLFLFFGAILLCWCLQKRMLRLAVGALAGLCLLIGATAVISPELFSQWADSLRSETTVAGAVPVMYWKTATLAGALRLFIQS